MVNARIKRLEDRFFPIVQPPNPIHAAIARLCYGDDEYDSKFTPEQRFTPEKAEEYLFAHLPPG